MSRKRLTGWVRAPERAGGTGRPSARHGRPSFSECNKCPESVSKTLVSSQVINRVATKFGHKLRGAGWAILRRMLTSVWQQAIVPYQCVPYQWENAHVSD